MTGSVRNNLNNGLAAHEWFLPRIIGSFRNNRLINWLAVDDINVDAPEGMTYAEWEASNVGAACAAGLLCFVAGSVP